MSSDPRNGSSTPFWSLPLSILRPSRHVLSHSPCPQDRQDLRLRSMPRTTGSVSRKADLDGFLWPGPVCW